MPCDKNLKPLGSVPCPADLGQVKSIRLTPEQIIENIKRLIREENTFLGQNMRIKSTYVRVTGRIEKDLFIMLKINNGKLGQHARAQLKYGQFTREELSDLYKEIMQYIKIY